MAVSGSASARQLHAHQPPACPHAHARNQQSTHQPSPAKRDGASLRQSACDRRDHCAPLLASECLAGAFVLRCDALPATPFQQALRMADAANSCFVARSFIKAESAKGPGFASIRVMIVWIIWCDERQATLSCCSDARVRFARFTGARTGGCSAA